MADENSSGAEDVPVNTPEYGCITDLSEQQAATSGESKKAPAKSAEPDKNVSETE
jgi:hypothetical protein